MEEMKKTNTTKKKIVIALIHLNSNNMHK